MDATKLLAHMAWANQEILTKVSELPDEALDAYMVNPEWTAREIIHHIVRSAHFYGYRLKINSLEDLKDGEAERARHIESEVIPAKSSDVKAMLASLRDADAILMRESLLPDGTVYREWEGEIIARNRSTVISQAVHHATEHRAQLISALEFRGYNTISLDDYDVWGYASTIGE